MVVVALENFAWLIPADDYLIPGAFKFSDIGIITALLWLVYIVYVTGRKIEFKTSIYPLIFIALVIISSTRCQHYFGQSMGLSIRQNRYILVSFLMYYGILHALKKGLLTKDDIISIIQYQGILEAILLVLQSALIKYFVFLHVNITFEYAHARIRASYLMPMLMMYISLNEYMNGRDRWRNLFRVFLGMFVLVGVCQHRAPSLIMLLTFGIAFLVWKKDASSKLVIGIALIVVLLSILYGSDVLQSALNVIFKGSSEGNTLTIRFVAQQYYMNRLNEFRAWMFGFGEPNINCKAAYSGSGALDHLFLADNGVFGFIYAHGIVGTIWLFLFFASLLRKSFAIMKRNRQYAFFLYIIYEIGNMYMGMHWYYYYAFPFILFIALIEWNFTLLKKEGRYKNEDKKNMRCGYYI